VLCGQTDTALPRFAGSLSDIRNFDSVIDAIADQMDKGIVQTFYDRLIQFRFFTFRGQLDLFTQVMR
jgi:hypothetical protein